MTLESKRYVIGGLGALFLVSLVIVQWLEANRDRKSTRLNSSHSQQSRMPSSA